MLKISKQIIMCFKSGGKLLICGNGGSASMSMHMAAEFVCSFENKERPPLPAIALTGNSSILTAWSNDFKDGFENVFARQIKALGKYNDLLITISTSGKSINCIKAQNQAKELEIGYIDFPRRGTNTAEIQEFQLHIMHQIIREVEKELFPC